MNEILQLDLIDKIEDYYYKCINTYSGSKSLLL